MRIKDFFNNEFREFSNYDNVRSVPSLVDGFKDSQRKAIFGLIENGQSEIKVAQAAGSCALCIHKDTYVNIGNKYETVENLYRKNYKNKILSYNLEEGNVELDSCLNIFYKGTETEFIEIETDNNQILLLTKDHKVLTKNNIWKRAVDLSVEDEIISL